MRLILDNGHGVDTPGKRSPVWSDGTQLLEWRWNRDIVNILQALLYVAGIPYNILVPEEWDVSLEERCQRANKIHAENANKDTYLISIHANAYKPNKAEGWEVWTSVGDTKADPFAQLLFEEASMMLPFTKRKDMTDGDADKEKDFTILYATDCPAVLTENGFMDNEKDCRFMLNETGKVRIAQAHLSAILKHIKYNEPKYI
jgi:N-acetylmuramoyl-L-alanine amidase